VNGRAFRFRDLFLALCLTWLAGAALQLVPSSVYAAGPGKIDMVVRQVLEQLGITSGGAYTAPSAAATISGVTSNAIVTTVDSDGTLGVDSLSVLLDDNLGSTQGIMAYRNATVWTVSDAGSSGEVWTSSGAGANPDWAAAGSSESTATITASDTLDANDSILLCNNSSDITLTLPAAASNTDQIYTIKKIGANANTVTLDGNGAETIDGATTHVLYVEDDWVRIICDGSNWHIVAGYEEPHVARVHREAAQSVNSASATKIAVDVAEVNIGGMADVTTNDRVDILRTGRYLVSVFVQFPNIDDAENVQVRSHVNGAISHYYQSLSSAADQTVMAGATQILELSAGDYVELYVSHNEGASQNTSTADPYGFPRLEVAEIR
jgi:hypothetical protein